MSHWNPWIRITFSAIVCLWYGLSSGARAEEILLFDNNRIYGLVEGVTKDSKGLKVETSDDQERTVPLEEIVSIRFLGRVPLLVQAGTQEFRFVDGGQLRGQVKTHKGDVLDVGSALAGELKLDLAHMKGFLALPLIGFSGRKAEELVESDRGRRSQFLDVVQNIWGSDFEGVVAGFTRTKIRLDSERYLRSKEVEIRTLAGVRLADAARAKGAPWKGEVQLRLSSRDGSIVQGDLGRIHLNRWYLNPQWNKKSVLPVSLDEISLVQVLGGRVQYLSQLTPVEVKEETILTPPQPYRMDRSCQGDRISIAGKRYPWGIGVHADSALTFEVNGRFKEFRADVGISTRMGSRGSVVFSVLGDGKTLFTSKPVRGSASKPLSVSVKLVGVQKLTLKVTNAGDLDLGDVANWGSARVLR